MTCLESLLDVMDSFRFLLILIDSGAFQDRKLGGLWTGSGRIYPDLDGSRTPITTFARCWASKARWFDDMPGGIARCHGLLLAFIDFHCFGRVSRQRCWWMWMVNVDGDWWMVNDEWWMKRLDGRNSHTLEAWRARRIRYTNYLEVKVFCARLNLQKHSEYGKYSTLLVWAFKNT